MSWGWDTAMALGAGLWLGFVAAHEVINYRNRRKQWP